MRVTCPKCQLKGLVDSGPLMLQTRALCVRCATSYEAVLVNGKVETFPPSSNGHSQAGEIFEWNLLEAEPLPDEPLELPGPVLTAGPLMQTEYVLEDLSAESPFERDLSLPETSFAPAQEEAQALPLELKEAEESYTPEETAWLYEETAVPYADNALPDEDDALSSQEASSWPDEEDEALPDEEAVQPSEAEVSSLSLVSPLSLISSSPVVPSSSFEAEVLPASETETERHESLPDVSPAPDSLGLMDGQPVGFVHTGKDVSPYQDKYSLGVRLMRVSPVWLLASGLLFISLIFAFNWATKPNAQANNLTFNHALNSSAANTAARQSASPAPAQATEETNNTTDRNPSMEVKAASPVNDAPLANAAPAAGPAPANPAAATVNTSHAVETKPAPEVNQPQPESRGSGNFTVQVGSYSDSAQAEARAAGLRSAGFDARLVAVELPRRGTWYRVQAGRFETREEAARYGQQLRTQKVAAETIITEIQNQ